MKISKVLLAVLFAMAFLISMSVASYAQTLDFTTGSLPSGVTMTGGAGTSYYDSSKVLHVANAANHPRFDHNPSSGAVLGILVEPANSTFMNISDPVSYTDTADLDHAGLTNFANANTGVWVGVWADLYPADATGPTNVANSAGTLVEDTTLSNDATIGHHSGNHTYHFSGVFPILTERIVISTYVKRNGPAARNITFFVIASTGDAAFLTIDLGSGAVHSNTLQGTGWTLRGNSVQAVNISGNPWWRISQTVDVVNADPNQWRVNWTPLDSNFSDGYQGDGQSGFQIYGVQITPSSTTTLANSYVQNATLPGGASSTADSVSFTIPSGIVSLTYTFDDNSTQTVSVSPGAFTINPSTLNRPWIKTVVMNSGSGAPNPPTGLSAAPGNNQVALSWTASSGATSYNVDRSTTSGSGYTTISSPTATNYTDTSVTNGTTYYYVVTATNSNGTSGYSSQVSATPSSSSSTAFLTGQTLGTLRSDFNGTEGFKFTVGSTAITVQGLGRWVVSGNTGTHTLTLEKASDNSVLGSVSVATSGATAGAVKYVNFGTAIPLAANTAYYVQSTETPGGDSCYDDDTTVTTTSAATVNDSVQNNLTGTVGAHSYGPLSFTYLTAGSPPPTPTGLSASPGNAQVALTWSASTGATSYNVGRSTTSGSGYTTINSPTTTSYTDTSVTNGTTYYYVVSATNGNGTSANSSQVSATPSAGGGGTAFVTGQTLGTLRNNYAPPEGIKITTGSSAITVQGLGRWVVSGNTGAHTMTLVRASDNSVLGSVSVPTSGATAGTFKYVNFGTPVALAASTAYYVMCAETVGGDYWYSDDTTVTTTSDATINNSEYVDNSGVYRTDQTGAHNYNPVSFTYTVSGSPPAAPTGLSASPGNAQVALSWTASSGATSYNVNRSTTSGSGYSTISSPTTTSYTDTSVTNGTTYYYVVTATNGSGTSGNSNQVSATPSSSGGTAFVTGQTLGALRNNSTTWVGTEITVGSTPITVNQVGRWVVSGNSGAHNVEVVQVSNGAILGSASVNTSGATSGAFKYVTLGTSIPLAASTSYYLLSQETSGGDQWGDNTSSSITHTSAATVPNSVYSGDNVTFTTNGTANECYVPVSFTYTTGSSSTSFLTGQTLGTLRSDFNGTEGFKFTVGSTAITVKSLGRWVVSGNTGTHTLTLEKASDNSVLGSVSVATSGATAGAVKYVNFGTAVPLAANTAYYVQSTETPGGDSCYDDDTTVTTTSAATVNDSIQNNLTGTVGAHSYGPVSFQY